MTDDRQGKDRRTRFHGRVEGTGQWCAAPGCSEPGEFRAPPLEGPTAGLDAAGRPPTFRWMCLEHVRQFNAGYNFFNGMTADEIHQAQRPYAGWERETRAFSGTGDRGPRWADFADPLDAIAARFRAEPKRTDGRALSEGERASLKVLGLGPDADRSALRKRYSELVRRYHPDRNGGDRSHEAALRTVIDAYSQLRKARAFA